MGDICDSTALRVDLIEAEKNLAAALRAMLDQLRLESDYAAWVWNGKDFITGPPAREFAAQMVGKLFYERGQDSRSADICPGLLACSPEAIVRARALNKAKDEFTLKLRELDTHLVPIYGEPIEGSVIETREKLSKVALSAMGYAHLHRKYAARKLTILPSRPDYVGMSWAHTKKVERLSKEQVFKRLGAMLFGPGVERDLLKLDELPEGESLAIVRQHHSHVRANMVWRQPAPGQKSREQRASRLPLLFASGAGEPLPTCAGMSNERKNAEHERVKGRKIEREMYLPSVHAHRYLPAYR